MPSSVRLRHRSTIEPPEPGAVRVATGVGPDGDLHVAWTTARSVIGAANARGAFDEGVAWRGWLTTHSFDAVATLEVTALPFWPAFVQPLPRGEYLLANPRCQWTPDGGEHHAAVLGPDGAMRRSGVLGDGIEDIQTTATGDVWVSYFDEGVFGNLGWGSAEEGREPIGSSGLARFDRHLARRWTYPEGAAARWGWMADCYALNVDRDHAWICYYTDFPVVRVGTEQIAGWANAVVAGAHALAVHGRTIAFLGSYDARDRLTVARLGEGELEPVEDFTLLPPEGLIVPAAWMSARGGTFHVVTETSWSTLDVREL